MKVKGSNLTWGFTMKYNNNSFRGRGRGFESPSGLANSDTCLIFLVRKGNLNEVFLFEKKKKTILFYVYAKTKPTMSPE